jgi:hypothetical protein
VSFTSALNVDAVSVNYYLYAVLLGVTEIPAYLLPTPVLMVMGRRQASSILFATSGLLLLVILALPRSQTVAIVSVSLISRFSLSAAYGIMILYASEFFPTVRHPKSFHLADLTRGRPMTRGFIYFIYAIVLYCTLKVSDVQLPTIPMNTRVRYAELFAKVALFIPRDFTSLYESFIVPAIPPVAHNRSLFH